MSDEAIVEASAAEAPVDAGAVIDSLLAGEVPPAEETTVETPVETPDPEKKRRDALSTDGKLDDAKISAAFAKLTSQERRAKARAQELQAERSKIEADRKAFEDARAAREADLAPTRELVKKNPVEFLLKEGWTKQQIADFIVNDEKLPPERLIAEADSRIKAQLDDLDRRQREFSEKVEKEKLQGTIREYETLVAERIRSSIDKYPLVKRMAAQEGEDLHRASLNWLAREYQQNGKALAPEAALEYFEKRLRRDREILLASENPGQAGAGKAAGTPGAGQPRPLTNDLSSERGVAPPAEDTDERRWEAVDKMLADAERGVYPE